MSNYTHLEPNQEIEALAGHYTLVKEGKLPWDGREVLYTISHAVVDSSCCGVANYRYALVPGFIVGWRTGRNKDGRPVSEVAPVTDDAARDEIRQTIQASEHVEQVEFW
jgi:hypothetical protein